MVAGTADGVDGVAVILMVRVTAPPNTVSIPSARCGVCCLDIQKSSNCTLPSGERAALVALQPSQLLNVRSPDHTNAPTFNQLFTWFLGVSGTRREQHLFKYAGLYGANPQQCRL